MIKKSFIFLLFLMFNHSLAFSDLNIVSRIDGEIITNKDIKKEINYLQILNPNLNQLNIEQLTSISKKSLINEIIKLTNNEFIEKKVHHIKPDFISNGIATHHCHSNSIVTVFDYLT